MGVIANLKGPKGDLGPQGPPGPSSSSDYASRADIVSDTIVYRAEAYPGTQDSDAAWRIRKIVISGETFADYWAAGNSNFDKVWDDRASYSYS